MGIADRRCGQRRIEQAGAADALALGLAQASALMPGVSRRGATLAAARLRGFSRADADELSWLTAIPVILGACALKGSRLLRNPPSGQQRAALLAGASTAFASTLASARAAVAAAPGRLAAGSVLRLPAGAGALDARGLPR